MLQDKQLQFSDAQAVTASAASDNIVDLKKAGNPMANNPYLEITTCEAATAAGAATVNFQLQTATDAAFTTPITLFDSGAIAKTALTLNSEPVRVRIPEKGILQYLRVYYVVGTGPLTAGKFCAAIAY